MNNPGLAPDVGFDHLRTPAARLGKVMLALIGISLVMAMPARAQSVSDIENQLYKKEQFFQPVNTEAPKFALQDADGRPWDLDKLRGKVVVLQFIYGSCKDICPLLSELLAHLQEMVNQTSARDYVQFVSITTDPARDAPDVLKAYGPIHGLDPANWVFLTISPSQPDNATRQLAERFGLKFTKTDDGEFVHAAVTNIIDRDGVLRAKFHGLNFDPTNLVSFVKFLVSYVHKPGEAEDIVVPSTPLAITLAPDLKAWMPVGLLALAVAWLVGAIAFFRFRRKRSGTVSSEQGGHHVASTPSATNDASAASRL